MKNLLTGIILGLLAVVHSAYVNTVILTEAESDDFQETMKDEFLIASLTTQLPKRNTTSQPSTGSKDSHMIVSSPVADSNDHTQSVTHAQSFTSTVVTKNMVDFRSDLPGLGFSDKLPDPTPANETVIQKTFLNPAHSTLTSDSGSGDGGVQGHYPATSSRKIVVSTTLSASTAPPTSTGSEGWGSNLRISEKLSESTTANEEIMPKTFLNHAHSILTSDSGSGDGGVQGHYPAISSRKIVVSTTLSASTAPPTSTGSEGWGSNLRISEKLSESTTANEEIMPKTFLNHAHSILTSDSGSGDRGRQGQYPATSSPRTEVSTALLASTAPPTSTGSEGSELESKTSVGLLAEKQSIKTNEFHQKPESTQNKSTPSWIIILAFLVGVAALVIVGVAIATRERWCGPNQISQLETQTNSSNQQRELEMKTLLNKDQPKENGKAAEYTIIPLDELPQSSTSH